CSWSPRVRAPVAPNDRAAVLGCPAPLLLWRRCGRSCARAQVPPACIARCNSPYAEPVCLAVSSCGFLGFLTLSPLSVKLGQAQADPQPSCYCTTLIVQKSADRSASVRYAKGMVK